MIVLKNKCKVADTCIDIRLKFIGLGKTELGDIADAINRKTKRREYWKVIKLDKHYENILVTKIKEIPTEEINQDDNSCIVSKL